MSEKPSTLRLLIGILLGASIALIGLALWMISQHQGAPVWVALAGSMLAALAAILGSQSRKKP